MATYVLLLLCAVLGVIGFARRVRQLSRDATRDSRG
jgi:hypothetical protein